MAKYAASILAAVALATALGTIYPLDKALDLSGWRGSQMRSMAQAGVPVQNSAAVAGVLGPRTCQGTIWNTVAVSGSHIVDSVQALAVTQDCDPDVTSLGHTVLVSGSDRLALGEAAICADLAHQLRVGVGDSFTFEVGPATAPAKFRVAGVLASRSPSPRCARVLLDDLRRAIPTEEELYVGQLQSGLEAGELKKRMSAITRSGLAEQKVPVEVADAQAVIHEDEQRSGGAAARLMLVFGLCAVLAAAAVAVRAVRGLVLAAAPEVAALNALGVSWRSLQRTAAFGVFGVTALVSLVGIGVGLLPVLNGWLVPCIAPWFLGTLTSWLAGCYVVVVVLAALSAWRGLRASQ